MTGPLAGIRAVLLDLDGTVTQDGRLLPGALSFLSALRERGIPWLVGTNTTSRPRRTLAREVTGLGLPLPEDRILTAAAVANRQLPREGLTRCLALVTDALREDLPDLVLDSPAPELVIVGDVGEGFTFARLNQAFRALLDGARLVALARSRYFRSGHDLVLDCGPFVAALEYASGRDAVLLGKPSGLFFESAFRMLGAAPHEVAVVGDDVENDVRGGQQAGARGILVRTGKFREADLERGPAPDAVVDSLATLASLASLASPV